MPGHLFTCKCDITKIACDAWLLPTYEEKRIESLWMNQCLEEIGCADGSVELIRRAETLEDYFATLKFEDKTWRQK